MTWSLTGLRAPAGLRHTDPVLSCNSRAAHPAALSPPGWPTIWYGSRMKVRDVLRLLRQDGWHLVAARGSH